MLLCRFLRLRRLNSSSSDLPFRDGMAFLCARLTSREVMGRVRQTQAVSRSTIRQKQRELASLTLFGNLRVSRIVAVLRMCTGKTAEGNGTLCDTMTRILRCIGKEHHI